MWLVGHVTQAPELRLKTAGGAQLQYPVELRKGKFEGQTQVLLVASQIVLVGQVTQVLVAKFQLAGLTQATHWLAASRKGVLGGQLQVKVAAFMMNPVGQERHALVVGFQTLGVLQAWHWVLLLRYGALGGQSHDEFTEL